MWIFHWGGGADVQKLSYTNNNYHSSLSWVELNWIEMRVDQLSIESWGLFHLFAGHENKSDTPQTDSKNSALYKDDLHKLENSWPIFEDLFSIERFYECMFKTRLRLLGKFQDFCLPLSWQGNFLNTISQFSSSLNNLGNFNLLLSTGLLFIAQYNWIDSIWGVDTDNHTYIHW